MPRTKSDLTLLQDCVSVSAHGCHTEHSLVGHCLLTDTGDTPCVCYSTVSTATQAKLGLIKTNLFLWVGGHKNGCYFCPMYKYVKEVTQAFPIPMTCLG